MMYTPNLNQEINRVTTFKEELEKILDNYYAPIKLPDNNREGLTQAIIELVDWEIEKAINEEKEQ